MKMAVNYTAKNEQSSSLEGLYLCAVRADGERDGFVTCSRHLTKHNFLTASQEIYGE